jgi:hypothetical protein
MSEFISREGFFLIWDFMVVQLIRMKAEKSDRKAENFFMKMNLFGL